MKKKIMTRNGKERKPPRSAFHGLLINRILGTVSFFFGVSVSVSVSVNESLDLAHDVKKEICVGQKIETDGRLFQEHEFYLFARSPEFFCVVFLPIL